MRHDTDEAPRARIPADVDTPDKIVYGLTARQLAILVVAALMAYVFYRGVGPYVPQLLLVAVLVPFASVAVVLALGRRDGIGLDAWLFAALLHRRAPQRATATPVIALPGWAPAVSVPQGPVAPLRLPATAITATGVIDTGARQVVLVACGTVNIGLRTGDEQAALIGAYGRWLNSLSAPVQIVVSAQRVDVSAHAQRIAAGAELVANPALAGAARDYAAFLHELAAHRDPLWRTVTVAVTGSTDTDVLRRAEHSATALATLGAHTSVLDGARATAVLTCAADPYSPSGTTWPRALPDGGVTTASPA